jgi:hypothetical protein
LWLYGISWSILGLTFLGPLREARFIGWFFPWLYVSLGAAASWFWTLVPQWLPEKKRQELAKTCLISIITFTFLYPQYFREVPRRWQVRWEPHIHQLAAEFILKNYGQRDIISSVEAEVAYRAGGYWIGQPNADAQKVVEWLYLGAADFLLITDRHGLEGGREMLWSAPEVVEQTFPELKLVASFQGVQNLAYGRQARLFRFSPSSEKLAAYRRQYPWAGTHPREVGAFPVPVRHY